MSINIEELIADKIPLSDKEYLVIEINYCKSNGKKQYSVVNIHKNTFVHDVITDEKPILDESKLTDILRDFHSQTIFKISIFFDNDNVRLYNHEFTQIGDDETCQIGNVILEEDDIEIHGENDEINKKEIQTINTTENEQLYNDFEDSRIEIDAVINSIENFLNHIIGKNRDDDDAQQYLSKIKDFDELLIEKIGDFLKQQPRQEMRKADNNISFSIFTNFYNFHNDWDKIKKNMGKVSTDLFVNDDTWWANFKTKIKNYLTELKKIKKIFGVYLVKMPTENYEYKGGRRKTKKKRLVINKMRNTKRKLQ